MYKPDPNNNFVKDALLERRMQPHLNLLYIDNGISIKRERDASKQKSGIDYYLKNKPFGDGIRTVDEKTATDYPNGYDNLNTFAHEICYTDAGGKLKIGWARNNENQTDAYGLSWIRTGDKCKSIEAIQHAILPVSFVHSVLDSLKIFEGPEVIQMLEGKTDKYGNQRIYIDNNISLMCSHKKSTRPYLLLLKKDFIRQNSVAFFDYDPYEWATLIERATGAWERRLARRVAIA